MKTVIEQCKESLLAFINTSTSPFHVVNKAEVMLRDKDFQELKLGEKWYLKEGDSYYVNVYGSTLLAFRIGENMRKEMRIASAHTDFPNIRIKPNPTMKRQGYVSYNIETYGGLIINTWMDRPLSVAGKVTLRTEDPFQPKTVYVDLKKPIVTIPNLAIHMNRNVNAGVEINKQTQLLPLAASDVDEKELLKDTLEKTMRPIDFISLLAEEIGCTSEDILFYELGLYAVEQGCSVGVNGEFISSPRLDNLTSVKACLEGILDDGSGKGLHMIALFDNEEVGSRTKQGAASTMLTQVLQRIYLAMGYSLEEYFEDVAKGFMISADVAHGYHPNYSEKNDLTNKPVLNQGFALKFASSQSYAGDAEAVAVIKGLCDEAKIPYQIYVNRSDIPGGSTLGSIVSAMLPIRTMDVGVPVLAMHSIRETMGENDQYALEQLMRRFFNR